MSYDFDNSSFDAFLKYDLDQLIATPDGKVRKLNSWDRLSAFVASSVFRDEDAYKTRDPQTIFHNIMGQFREEPIFTYTHKPLADRMSELSTRKPELHDVIVNEQKNFLRDIDSASRDEGHIPFDYDRLQYEISKIPEYEGFIERMTPSEAKKAVDLLSRLKARMAIDRTTIEFKKLFGIELTTEERNCQVLFGIWESKISKSMGLLEDQAGMPRSNP